MSFGQVSPVVSIALSVSVVLGLMVISFAIRQHTNKVLRDRWWRRTAWALSWATDTSRERSAVGWAAIRYQLNSHDASTSDRELLRNIADRLHALENHGGDSEDDAQALPTARG